MADEEHGGFKVGQPVYVAMPGCPHGIIVGFPTGDHFEEPVAGVRFMTRGHGVPGLPMMGDNATTVLLTALRASVPSEE